MHNKLLVIQNISHEGPGILGELIQERRISTDCFDLSRGATLPDPRSYAGIVVLGGPQSANDKSNQILHELEIISKALEAGIPYLGICLGLQLLVAAAGGQVVRCHLKEIGFREPDGEPFTVELTEEGQKDLLFACMPTRLRVFQLHGETVNLTRGMTLLATGKSCTNQVVRVGSNAWGLQCHFEMTHDMFDRWLDIDSDLITMNKSDLLAEFASFRDEYTATGRKILLNFLEKTGLIT
jgi:GMP synthase-like glutamine amidotransferase